MINTVYRLVQPGRFELDFSDIRLDSGAVLVRPTCLSICNADRRYYLGLREAHILQKKLPMALIHEAVGEVVYDPDHRLPSGQRVVMIPNVPFEKDEFTAENYLRSSKFRSSSCDGFMREYVDIASDRIIALPDTVKTECAAYTELVSVCLHAVKRFQRFSHERRETVGVWGDGNVSYLITLILKMLLPETKVYVFGIVPEKLALFSFADKTFFTTEASEDLKIDHAFECVGSNGSQTAINQIIDVIRPEGTISILGVSEYPVPINTRMVLEKGLRLFGSSRSGYEDFHEVVKLYEKNEKFVDYTSALLYSVESVRTVPDINRAFDADAHKSFGKTVMRWLR